VTNTTTHYLLALTLLLFTSLFAKSTYSEENCRGICHYIPGIENSLDTHFQANTDQTPNKLSLLIWNIYKFKKKSFAKDFVKLSKNKDIILLQEFVDKENWLNIFFKSLRRGELTFAKSFLYKNNTATGVATISSGKTEHTRALRSKYREPVLLTPKMSLLSYFKIQNKRLLVMNVHGLNFTREKALFSQVADLAQEISKHRGPVIFAGDFNTRTKSRLAGVDRILEAEQLRRLEIPYFERTKKLDLIYTRGLKNAEAFFDFSAKGSDHPPMILKVEI